MDRHVESRLKKDLVIWIVTAGRDRLPQAVPVWFLWDGRSFLIYAQDGNKVEDVKANPNVELHLNSDEAGNDVIRVSGQATVAPHTRRMSEAYVRKYRRDIKNLGLTPETMVADFHNAIRVRRLRYH